LGGWNSVSQVQARIAFADGMGVKTVHCPNRAASSFPRTLAIGLVMLAGNCCLAEGIPSGQFVHFTNRQDGFTLTLPSGWKEMPPELNGIFVDPDALPGHQLKAYGYQLATAEGLLDTPFVTVHVVTGFRLPERLLATLTNEELRRKAVLKEIKHEGFLERDIHETSYDTNRHAMRVSLSQTERGVRMRALNGLFYTQQGVIAVSCVSEAGEFDTWADRFGQVLDSFAISPAVRYQARPGAETRNVALEGAKWRVQALTFAFVGSLVWYAFQWRQNRIMSDEI
jgi:hypothetical protein